MLLFVIGLLFAFVGVIALIVRATSAASAARSLLGRAGCVAVVLGLVSLGVAPLVHVPVGDCGVVVRRFGAEVPAGRVVALEGQRGPQAAVLASGWHYGYWPWLYTVDTVGLVVVPDGQIGVVTALDGQVLTGGRVFAPAWKSANEMLDATHFLTSGEGFRGPQLTLLLPGNYRVNPWLFAVALRPATFTVPSGQIGLVSALDGRVLPRSMGFAPAWKYADEMLNASLFLAGTGYRGRQLTVLVAGCYRTSPLFTVELHPVTSIAPGEVGVVKATGVETYTGTDQLIVNGAALVPPGYGGIWNRPLPPGTYDLHPGAFQVSKVKTSLRVYSYGQTVGRAPEGSDPGGAGQGVVDNSIMVRSKDGIKFPVEVRLSLAVAAEHTPYLVAWFGDPDRIVADDLEDGELEILQSRLVLPATRVCLRLVAESVSALEFVSDRNRMETMTAKLIEKELRPYKIELRGLSFGVVGSDPEGAGKQLPQGRTTP